jgi:hypothetical protein
VRRDSSAVPAYGRGVGSLIHQHQQLWSTEPLWLWRLVLVAWWLVVLGAVISLASAVLSQLVNR